MYAPDVFEKRHFEMKEIQAEGITFFYLTKNDVLPHNELMGMTIRETPLLGSVWHTVIQENLDDMRAILISYGYRPKLLHVSFLHWNDGTDLDLLDRKVIDGKYNDNDFQNAVIAKFGRTICTKCNWEGYTLVFYTSEAYIDNAELEQEKMRSRQEAEGFMKCPNCQTRLRQMVVKVFLKGDQIVS